MKIELARDEARAQQLDNVEFVVADLRGWKRPHAFDAVYARFVLTHLPEPEAAIAGLYDALRAGGIALVEDIDFNGSFVFPDNAAFRRFRELYCAAVDRRGGDANIGPRLPLLLKRAGFQEISVSIGQPVGLAGDIKLVYAVTLENMADAVVKSALATREEIDDLVHDLYAFAADPETLTASPRVVQVRAGRPG